MNNELISVVVPIYKVEDYIKRSIESIINQTYKNLEIILVDDGSPDNCPYICEKYAKIDSRIKVFHKVNGGLSDARNFGILKSNGSYIIFIDSDDFIEKDMIQKLYNSIKENNSDIAICNFDYIYENGSKSIPIFPIENKKMTGNDATNILLNTLAPQMVVSWNKLEKKSLWNDLKFPIGKQHEDDFTTYNLLYNANYVSFVNEPLYHYYQRENSIIGVGFNEKSLHKIEAYEKAMCFFKDKNKKYYKRCANIVLIMIKKCCEEAYSSSCNTKEKVISDLREKGRKFYKKHFFDIRRGIRYHLKMFIFFYRRI